MECSYNLIKEGSDSRELVWREIKELRTTLVDSFIRFWHQEVISNTWYENPKRTALLHCSYACVHDHIYFFPGLHNLKSEHFQVGMGFSFPWPILSCIDNLIHSPRWIVGYQSFCVVGLELFVETWKYNNFVLSDTKPNNHIKTQKQIKITKWERKYCQIRELKQDIRLLHTEESRIGFQS